MRLLLRPSCEDITILINPKLRQRILKSLRWLVRDAQWRFNECKDNIDNGSQGGYSDELKEATQLLQDLEQGTMFVGSDQSRVIAYSEQQCKDVGLTIGMSEGEATEFFLKYGTQGWLLGNGLPIVDLNLAMRQWKVRNQKQQPTSVDSEYDKLKKAGEI